MFDKLKRKLLRAKLKKAKRNLLIELVDVNKKLKILDRLDQEDKERQIKRRIERREGK